MNELEKEIIAQYGKRYFSVQQIADNLKITSSKVGYVLKKFDVKKRNISEAIKRINVTKFGKENFHLKKELNNREEKLRVAGVMLYWGEGTKNGNSVAFSNSNPEMVLLFLKFLRKICGTSEKRIRALLHIYEDQNEEKLRKYWSEKIKIPQKQFSKSFLHNSRKGTYKKNSEFGTISIRYSDKDLLKIINSWIDKYSRKL